MQLRWILYGYAVENGIYIIAPNEADNVRMIFEMYSAGNTFSAIATFLSEKNVDYYKGKSTWNKNMVSRIIENSHYIGDEIFPPIIEKELFDRCAKRRTAIGGKRKEDPPDIKFIKAHIFCGRCGQSLYHTEKRRGRKRWECEAGCKPSVSISDENLTEKLIASISFFISSSYDALPSFKTYQPDTEIVRRENELRQMLDSKGLQFAPIQKTVLECVSRKFDYCLIDKVAAYTNNLRSYLDGYDRKTAPNSEMLRTLIERIDVWQDGTITVTFRNGQKVNSRRREENAGA